MGWKLAEEVASARPPKPGPEWWTLMDIALDARDETRQGMPGEEFLMNRAGCSKATFYRHIKALTDAGLIKVVRRSAPGVRAVYEVPPLVTGLSVSETRSCGKRVAAALPGVRNGSQKPFETGLTGPLWITRYPQGLTCGNDQNVRNVR